MRLIRILGVVLSVLAAAASVWWLRNGGAREAEKQAPVPTLSLVVAAEPLRYGQRITAAQVKVIEWHGASLPSGAFEKVEAIGIDSEGPFALTVVAEGAPILKSQITVKGQKPSLSARLNANEVAVTLPVNPISGVAGFVLPEERVDVLLNRKVEDRHYADVILQNVRVLAVNSVPDAGGGEPVQAKSVTVALSREDAQRLDLASNLGEISLVLRSPLSEAQREASTISDLELFSGARATGAAEPTPVPEEHAASVPPLPPEPSPPVTQAMPEPAGEAEPPAEPETTQVIVIRGVERHEVTVP
jgi:pilus assembly protein CpaB